MLRALHALAMTKERGHCEPADRHFFRHCEPPKEVNQSQRRDCFSSPSLRLAMMRKAVKARNSGKDVEARNDEKKGVESRNDDLTKVL